MPGKNSKATNTDLSVERRGFNPAVFKYEHKARKFLGVPVLGKTLAKGANKELSRPRIRQAFLDVNMASRHFGLMDIATKAGIDPSELQKGEFLLFISSTKENVALLGWGGTLTYISKKYTKELGFRGFTSDEVLLTVAQCYHSQGFDADPKLHHFLSEYLRPTRRVKQVQEEV